MQIKLIRKFISYYRLIPIQAKLVLWLAFSSVVQRGINVITVPIFTRLMSTYDYGKVSSYLAWVNVFTIFCSLNLYSGVYNKGLSKFKDNQEQFCLAMQYTTSLTTLVAYGVYFIFRIHINSLTGLNTYITTTMFLQIFFSTSMIFWSIKKQYNFRYKEVVIATLLYAFFSPIVGLILVLLVDYNLRGLIRILSIAIAQIFFGSFFYYSNIKNANGKYIYKYSIYALKFNFPLIPHYLSEYILNQSDRIMIQKLCSYTQVAFYSVAYSAGMLLTILTSSINQAITPWLYKRLDEGDIEKVGNLLYKVAIILLIPITIFIAFAPEAIGVLAGKSYASAVYVIPPVSGSVLFLFLYTNMANIEFYYDYNKFTKYISMVGAGLNILLNIIFIKRYGYVAAAYTSYICYFVYCMGHYLFINKIIKIKFSRSIIEIVKLMRLILIQTFIMIIMSLAYYSNILRYIIIFLIILIFLTNYSKIRETLAEFVVKDR